MSDSWEPAFSLRLCSRDLGEVKIETRLVLEEEVRAKEEWDKMKERQEQKQKDSNGEEQGRKA